MKSAFKNIELIKENDKYIQIGGGVKSLRCINKGFRFLSSQKSLNLGLQCIQIGLPPKQMYCKTIQINSFAVYNFAL